MANEMDTEFDAEITGVEQPDIEDVIDDSVEIHRDWPVSAVVGGLAAVVTILFLARAVAHGSGVDWLLGLVVAVVAGLHLAALADARAPLMVIDRQGVRVRRGRAWRGVSWPEAVRVEHVVRTSLLRDGRLDVVDVDGASYGVRLSLGTRIVGANWHELTDALRDLAEDRAEVVETLPEARPAVEPVAEEPTVEHVEEIEPVVEPEAEDVAPERAVVPAVRSEIVLERPRASVTPSSDVFDQEADQRSDRDLDETTVTPLPEPTVAFLGEPVGELDDEPVADPVVGPVLATARARFGLTVEQLSERTRIRPHVIEGIEVDDFEPCGGDFYARGHLRTLARVLGVDVEPLLAEYDERYADLPIDPRRVFEAELASGGAGAIRGTRGGLNWSVLVAAVMAVVLVWSVARLVLDHPTPVKQHVALNGSPSGQAALESANTSNVKKVPVELTAATGGARVTVRDGRGKVVFTDQLPFDGTADVQVAPPVHVTSSDGGLTVKVAGKDKGAIGSTGKAAKQTYVP